MKHFTLAYYRDEVGQELLMFKNERAFAIERWLHYVDVNFVLNEALSLYGKPEIFNTDQGSQYTSYIHTQTLKDNGIIISMDGKGRATDNICIERFWRSAKVEKIYLNEYKRVSVLKSDLKEYMEFYNYRRFHETLGYKKPMNVYYESLKINEENYTKSSEDVA